MIASSHERAEFEGARWKAVRLGLRLANSHVGLLALARFYLIWGLIGLILCVILIPFAVLGNMKAFEAALNPIALYAVADRLAQPEGRWRHFDRSGLRGLVYRDPRRSATA